MRDSPEKGNIMMADMKRGLNHKGWKENMKLMQRDWGFELSEIKFENCFLMYSEVDHLAPMVGSKWLGKMLNATEIVLSGYGHFSILDGKQLNDALVQIFKMN
jgi:hypothetical protein